MSSNIFQHKWYNTRNILIGTGAAALMIGIAIWATTTITKKGGMSYYSSDIVDALGFNLEMVCDKDSCKWEKVVIKRDEN